jgi:streptogramin lyase
VAGGIGRSIALDRDGNIYVGIQSEQAYYKLSGFDGSLLGGPFSVSGHQPYGAAVDANGILWGASLFNGNILKFDTTTNTMIDLFGTSCYGIALGRDAGGNTRVYLGSNSPYREFDSGTETFLSPAPSLFFTNGIATDGEGNIVGGDSSGGGAAKFAPDGSLLWQSPQQAGVGSGAYSVVVDANNDVWTVHLALHR